MPSSALDNSLHERSADARFVRRCAFVCQIASCGAIAVGCTGFAGWVLDADALKSAFTGNVTMKANAALCLMLSGVALWLVRRPDARTKARMVSRLAGTSASLIAGVTLAQHITGYDFGIDQLLFRELPGSPATASPGRMGAPAATSFVLFGAAILLIDRRAARHGCPSHPLALLMLLIVALPLIGYAYSIRSLYGFSKYTGIAAHTAVAIALLAVGLLTARPTRGVMAVFARADVGGVMARRLLLPSVLVPLVLGWLRTVGQRAGLFDEAFGRPMLILLLIVIFASLVWWNARALSALEQERSSVERDRRRLYDELRERAEELARSNAAKDQFLAMLSHELRTPLTPVLLTSSMLEANPELPEAFRGDIATIRQNVELESKLISDLLDLTRVASGKLSLDVQDVDVHAVLHSALAVAPRDSSIRLELDLSARRHVMRGDPVRLQQVFWNLLSNAYKFTAPSGSVSIRTRDMPGERLSVEITDTGEGLEEEVLPRLFTAFEQGHGRGGRTQAGLGLGLAITKRLTEAHGGTITAASAGRGRGATFMVTLPSAGTPAAAPAPADVRAPTRQRALVGETSSVLLVEDHEVTLNVLSRLLQAKGFLVTRVSSVAGALESTRQTRYNLIISDVGLPDGSGHELLRQLDGQYAGRAIALSGFGMDSDVAASLEAGFAVHLTKPVDVETLYSTIEQLTGVDVCDNTKAGAAPSRSGVGS